MTKDEALRLALEALENSDDLVRENAYSAEQLYGNYPARQGKVRGLKALVEDHEKAITAIKAALANEALERKSENARQLGLDYESGYSTGFMDGAIKAQQANDGCQCPACKVAPHASDCAVHNEPAYPTGKCNCGAKGEPVGYWQGEFIKDGWATLYEVPQESVFGRKYRNIPLYSAPQKQPPVIDKSVARRIATQLGWEPPRKPLTDEEIERIYNRYGGEMINCAKAIERAHGIKGEA